METKIYKIQEVDFDKINFMKPIMNKSDVVVKIFYLSDNKKKPLLVQIPSLYINDTYNGKGTLAVPLVGKDNETSRVASTFFTQVDNLIIRNLKNILTNMRNDGKYKFINYKDISYRAIVNELEGDDNEIYKNGLIRLKLYDINDFKAKVYDEDKKIIDDNEYEERFCKGSYVKSIIEIQSLVIRNNSIHVCIKPHQIRVQTEKIENVTLDEYSFVDSDNEPEKDILLNTQTDFIESPVKTNNKFNVVNTNTLSNSKITDETKNITDSEHPKQTSNIFDEQSSEDENTINEDELNQYFN